MTAPLARFTLTPALAKPPCFGEIGGGLQKPWTCHYPGCKESGVSPSRNKKYCDRHAKVRNAESAVRAQKKSRAQKKAGMR